MRAYAGPNFRRQQADGQRVTFRADDAFAKPETCEALEERSVNYAIRIPANKSLELEIEDILFRPPGRPSFKPLVRYKSFRYQAAVLPSVPGQRSATATERAGL